MHRPRDGVTETTNHVVDHFTDQKIVLKQVPRYLIRDRDACYGQTFHACTSISMPPQFLPPKSYNRQSDLIVN